MTASPARCTSATTGSLLQGVDYLAAAAAVAVSALLVVGRRGAVLPGVAGLDHRDGVAHPACASAHRAHRGPGRLLGAPVSGGPGAGRGRIVCAVTGIHSR